MNAMTVQDCRGMTLGELGQEVRLLTRQARSMVLGYGVEIGRRLAAAKDKVPYGQWGAWVEEETDFSQSTAGRFIKLFEEYGAAQGSLFGAEVESSTLTKVSVSNALRLLAIPAEEREAFAEEVDAEHLSSRALEAAIEEHRKAEARATAAEASLAETEDRLSELEEELEHRDRVLSRAAEAQKEAEARAAEAEKAGEEAREALLKQLKATEEKLRAAEEARDKAIAETVDAGALAAAKKEAESARKEIAALQKKVQVASSGAGTAAVYAQLAQENFAKAVGTIAAMSDKDTAKKLRAGMADILRRLLAQVEEA